MTKKLLSIVVLTLAFASLLQAQDAKAEAIKPSAVTPSNALTEARHAIDKGNAQWVEAWGKGDAAMVADIFTEDGVWLGEKGTMYKGRPAIAERAKSLMRFTGKDTKITVTTVDVWLDGDVAHETGTYRYDYQEKGKPASFNGRYVTTWKRQRDGGWKLTMDMDVPLK